MSISVGDLKKELLKYPGDYKVRVLYGWALPILYLNHEDITLDLDEGCTLVTSDELSDDFHENLRIETVKDLLWHLQFFNDTLLVGNYDIEYVSSYIHTITDDVKDDDGNKINDTVFLIAFAHVGLE